MKKNDPTLPAWNTIETRLPGKVVFENTARAYQQCKLKFQTHEGMHSKSKISNFKLLVHPIEQDIFYFGQDMNGQKKLVRDKELISRKAEHFSIADGIFLVNVFQPKMALSFKALHNN